MMIHNEMLTIIGPTASGKTALATAVAATMNAEIISADSRQVYRGMTIGTGKDLQDYQVNNKTIPYHLIDICEPGTKYNLFRYQEDFMKAYHDIRNRGKFPILCGGTGLYVESVIKGYDLSPVPQNPMLRKELEGKTLQELTRLLSSLKERSHTKMHNTTDVDTAQRAIRAIEIETYNLEHPVADRTMPAICTTIICIDIDREERRRKITERLKQRLDTGMIEEIQGLLQKGIAPEDLIYYGLEYKYVTEYVIGQSSYEDMFRRLEIAIHQFAKRQMTWFRGMERRGLHIHWIDASLPIDTKIHIIHHLMSKQ